MLIEALLHDLEKCTKLSWLASSCGLLQFVFVCLRQAITAVEDALKEKGGLYERGATWQSFCVEDGLLITGQNPASSEAVAHALMKKLGVH